MSAPTAAPILSIEDLTLPPGAQEVLDSLTDHGKEQFKAELGDAVYRSVKARDFRPVLDVMLAWYRTLVSVRHDGFDEAYGQARELLANGEGGFTLDEFRARFKLPAPEPRTR